MQQRLPLLGATLHVATLAILFQLRHVASNHTRAFDLPLVIFTTPAR
jgi:hypothetical protein